MKVGLLVLLLSVIGLATVEGLNASPVRKIDRMPASAERAFIEKGNVHLGLVAHGIKSEEL